MVKNGGQILICFTHVAYVSARRASRREVIFSSLQLVQNFNICLLNSSLFEKKTKYNFEPNTIRKLLISFKDEICYAAY